MTDKHWVLTLERDAKQEFLLQGTPGNLSTAATIAKGVAGGRGLFVIVFQGTEVRALRGIAPGDTYFELRPFTVFKKAAQPVHDMRIGLNNPGANGEPESSIRVELSIL